ncbi:hypothetical protein BYT27DRAFT_7214834 [Phlegmacium glaucopus]|nr:hypothetical protein BYT27DRAFT_7214834 [Phlegmacium glaucopus]
MTDTIRECYGTLCRTLDDLSGEPPLPDTISEPLKKAHEMRSMLGDAARERPGKDSQVFALAICRNIPTPRHKLQLCSQVSEILLAIEKFNDARVPETWKSEIERRCPVKLLESPKSPYDMIIDTLATLKHSLSGLSVAFSIYIHPKVRQTVHSSSHVGYFDTQSIRLSQYLRSDTFAEIHFPHSYIAPRLPHGFSYIDVDHCADIRVKAAIEEVKKASAVYHATFWGDTVLYRMTITSFNFGPANINFLTGEHSRDLVKNPSSPHSLRINFEHPFVTPPKVVASSTALTWIRRNDVASGQPPAKLTGTDSRSLLKDRRHIFSASVNTREASLVGKEWKNAIKYTDVKFWRTPDVFVALNEINSDGRFDLRIKAYVANVTTIGLTWHIDTWSDSVLHSAGATIIAVN